MDNFDLKHHESYMRMCIALAKIAKQRGDSPVGSLIVQNGKIIGEGIEGGKRKKTLRITQKLKRSEMRRNT